MAMRSYPPRDGRRVLLAAGTAQFSEFKELDLDGVPDEIHSVTETLSTRKLSVACCCPWVG
jgi:hypothetical protein